MRFNEFNKKMRIFEETLLFCNKQYFMVTLINYFVIVACFVIIFIMIFISLIIIFINVFIFFIIIIVLFKTYSKQTFQLSDMPIHDRHLVSRLKTEATGRNISSRSLSLDVGNISRLRPSTINHPPSLPSFLSAPQSTLEKHSKKSSFDSLARIFKKKVQQNQNESSPAKVSKLRHHPYSKHHPSHPNNFQKHRGFSHPTSTSKPSSIQSNILEPSCDNLSSYSQNTKNSIEDRIPPILIEEDEAVQAPTKTYNRPPFQKSFQQQNCGEIYYSSSQLTPQNSTPQHPTTELQAQQHSTQLTDDKTDLNTDLKIRRRPSDLSYSPCSRLVPNEALSDLHHSSIDPEYALEIIRFISFAFLFLIMFQFIIIICFNEFLYYKCFQFI